MKRKVVHTHDSAQASSCLLTWLSAPSSVMVLALSVAEACVTSVRKMETMAMVMLMNDLIIRNNSTALHGTAYISDEYLTSNVLY